jgi:hypothetical protein
VICSRHTRRSTLLRYRGENPVTISPLELEIPKTQGSKFSRILTCGKPSSNLFRINTCKSATKQTTLTVFRMNTYAKHRGEGVLLLTRNPKKDFYPEGAPRPRDLSSRPMRESVLRSIATIPDPALRGKDLSSHVTTHLSRPGREGSDLVGRNFYSTRHSPLATRHLLLAHRPRFASHPHSFLLNYSDTTFQMAGPAGHVPHSAQRPRSRA